MHGVIIHYKSLERYDSEDQPVDWQSRGLLERYDSENHLLDPAVDESLDTLFRKFVYGI